MIDDLIHAARACRLAKKALRSLGRRLPGDDELSRVLGDVVEARYDRAFTALSLAALDAGRSLDASILEKGAALLPDPGVLAKLAVRMSGEVATHLFEAVRAGHMGWEREAVGLFLAVWWCQKEGRELPDGLAAETRVLARKPIGIEAGLFVHATADLLEDEVILGLVGDPGIPSFREDVRRAGANLIAYAQEPVLEGLEEHPVQVGSPGRTVRRSVEKIGRNAPCPCGSGAKYKRCCAGKDRERLSDCSDVPGVTRSELRAEPEPYLTRERLFDMRSFELARLDPSLVDPRLHSLLVIRLQGFGEFEAIAELFDCVGWREELDKHLLDSIEIAVESEEHEIARRLSSIRPAGAESELGLAARVAIAELEKGPMLAAFEAAARDALEGFGEVDVAHALFASSLPALGVLVGRGAIALANPFDAEVLLERILECRDRLELDPDDPAEAIFDAMHGLWSPEEVVDLRVNQEDDLQERQQELDGAQTQIRRLREEVRSLKEAASQAPPPSAEKEDASKPEGGARQESWEASSAALEIRQRLAATREELKQRHAERNTLRRDLDQARREMEKMREATSVTTDEHEEGDQEENLLLEEGILEGQPVRLISHSRGFSDQLGAAVRPVARATLRLAGRLAAGDPSGFRGSRRLRLDRTLWRQKIGRSHRLLFRLHPQELELLALVDRRNLEKTIKKLAS